MDPLPKNIIFVIEIIDARHKIDLFIKERVVEHVARRHAFGIDRAFGAEFAGTVEGIVDIPVAVMKINDQLAQIRISQPGSRVQAQLDVAVLGVGDVGLVRRASASPKFPIPWRLTHRAVPGRRRASQRSGPWISCPASHTPGAC